jgi:hypothetical protein
MLNILRNIVILILLVFISNAKSEPSYIIHPDTTFDVICLSSCFNDSDTTIFRKINKNVPTIAIDVILKDKEEIFFPVEKLIIKDSATGKLIQVIDPETDSLGIVNIEFNDFNFDGYIDLYVYDGCAISANCFGKVYLYNKELNKFIRDYAFDDLTSVQIDKDKKTILSLNSSGAGAYRNTKIFKFYKGKLTLIKEIDMCYDFEKSVYIYTVKEFNKKGKLVKTKKIISDDFDMDLE